MTYLNTAVEGIPPLEVHAALSNYFEDKQIGMEGHPFHDLQYEAVKAFRHPALEAIQSILQGNKVHVMASAGRIRVAIHGYNTHADIERFLSVLSGALASVPGA